MQISYILTEQDSVNAQKAHAWRMYKTSTMRVFSIINPLLGIILLVQAGWLYKIGESRGLDVLLMVLGLYLILAKAVIAPWYYRRLFRRRQHGPPHEIIFTFMEETIECESPGRSQSTMVWSAILGMLDSKTTVLLYVSPVAFFNIPKRALTFAQIAELTTMLKMKNIPIGAPKAHSN